MSQVKVSGNASGTGTLTIAAPNTNSDYTQTLPTASGNIVLDSATQTLSNKTISGNLNMTGGTKYQVGGVTTNALAWVNFAGASGTRNASYNVSSVTRNAAGDYTIAFANAMTDANYSLCGMAVGYASGNPAGVCVSLCGNTSYSAAPLGKTTSSVRVLCGTYAIATDSYEISVNIFGN